MKDFLEQLAEADVPPPPARFDRQLHERVNRSLLLVQMIELICGALPWAAWHFCLAVIATLRYTLTGRYDRGGGPQRN